MSKQVRLLLIWLGVMSLLAFVLFAQDKFRARRGRWRTPEAVLLGVCLCGGALGGLLGMRLFHHKTRKGLFRIGVPLMLLPQIALFLWALRPFPFG